MSASSTALLRVRGFREGTQFTVPNDRPGSEVGSRSVISGHIDPNDEVAVRYLQEQGYTLEPASGSSVFDPNAFASRRIAAGMVEV